MSTSTDKIRELLQQVIATEPTEIDCEELLARVGAYVESATSERELSVELRVVAQHLEVCPECKEEIEALLRAEGAEH
jgi:hypothetical protein